MAAKKTELPKPRCLTLGYHSYDIYDEYGWTGIRKVPTLRMSGEWLKNAGFTAGQRVRVHVAERCITIIPEA
jgi:hypothetical protein